jgi:hypothetical protein
MSSREKTQADFDLEAFIELFDEALTSDDPSVQKTLQHLMVIAALARNHSGHNERIGPLRQLFDDQRNIIRRLDRLESDKQRIYPGGGLGGGMGGSGPPSPYAPGIVWPSSPGTYPPGTIWAQNQTSTGTTIDPGYGAVPPSSATSMVAERVQDLLKSPNYKGSSVGANDKE